MQRFISFVPSGARFTLSQKGPKSKPFVTAFTDIDQSNGS